MSVLRAYDRLESLGGLITTGEAAAALNVSVDSASRTLRTLASHGRAARIRSGLWHVGSGRPLATSIVLDLCRPYPGYTSFESALNIAGVIDQLPRAISVASLGRARTIETSIGMFEIHHLPPALFGGWEETAGGPIATPTKAIFDLCYISAVSGGRPPYVPELDMAQPITLAAFEPWLSRIASPRIRSLTINGLRDVMKRSRAR
jgi:predicted transcriptional regulator of viral defense system